MKKLFLKLRAKRKKGFTLLEMLVVVVILGVLAAIAIPTYNRVMHRSRVADGLNMLDVLASAQNKYFVEHGQYTDNLADLNAPIKKNNIIDDFKIITTNFTYTKEPQKSCVYAESADGKYTLVKNFKTNAKTKCNGSFCEEISSFVESTNNLNDLCPEGSDECNLNEEICLANGFAGFKPAPACECIPVVPNQCSLNLEKCIDQGYTGFDGEHCKCTGHAVCTNGDTQWVDFNTACKAVDCGHSRVQQKCENGAWVNTEVKDCSNQWLIDKCGGSANVNWADARPACTCKTTTENCTHNGKKYEINGTYSEYVDDDSCQSDKFCKIKYVTYICAGNNEWKEYNSECRSKEEYCTSLGLVLNNNDCSCGQAQPTPCTGFQPACGKLVVDDTPKGSSPQSGPGNVSADDLMCYYFREVAQCVQNGNEYSWQCVKGDTKYSFPAKNASGYPNPDTQSCDQDGTYNADGCGIKKIETVTCTLENAGQTGDPSFKVFTTWGACALPEDDPTACWPGSINPNTGQTCNDSCHWQNQNQCPANQTPSGSNIMACHTNNGVTNENLYCGTMTTTQKKCDASTNYTWVWDFSNATCEHVYTNPNEPQPCNSDKLCTERIYISNCTLQFSQQYQQNLYMWDPNGGQWGECHLKTGAQCSLLDSLPAGQHCTAGCRKATCKSGSTWIEGLRKCVKSTTLNGIAFYYGGNTTTPYATNYGYCNDGNYHMKASCPTQYACGSSPATSYTYEAVTAVSDPMNCANSTNLPQILVQKHQSSKCGNGAWGGGTISSIYKCVEGEYNYVN